ncbi:uncharacterized protein LOC134534619 [Bacillus rossius redtenbacheri]|uniref:uncharacterized protein LOC134534619 n=1 Tax=Bacillus rossius redtenbacheri TaxID=93214 RepID=UPI002FDD0C4B
MAASCHGCNHCDPCVVHKPQVYGGYPGERRESNMAEGAGPGVERDEWRVSTDLKVEDLWKYAPSPGPEVLSPKKTDGICSRDRSAPAEHCRNTLRTNSREPEQHEQAWLPPPPPRPAAYSASQLLRARTTRASVASPTTSQAGRLQCVPANASQNNTSKRGFPHHLPGRPPTVRPSYCEPEQHEQAWLPPPPPRPAAYSASQLLRARTTRASVASPTTSQAGRLQCVPATASQNNTSKRGFPHHLPGRPPTVRPSYCEPEQHEQAWLPPPPPRPAAYSASQLLRARTTRASVASPTTSQAGRLQCVPATASQNNTSRRGCPHHLPGRPPTVRPSYCEPEQHEQAWLPPPPPRPAAYSASQLLRARTTRASVASPTTSQAGRLQCVPATASQNNTSKRGFPHHLPGRPPTVRPSYCEPEQHEQAWLPPPPPRPAAYSASQLLRARTTRASVASPTTSQAGRLQCVPATASQNNTSKRGFPHHLPGRPPTVRPSYCEPEQHEQAWLPPPPPRPAAYSASQLLRARTTRAGVAAPTTSQAGRLQCVPATASQNNTSRRGCPHHLPGRPPTVRPSYCEPEQHEQARLPPPPPRPAAYSASQLLRARTTRAGVASPTTSQAGRLQCVPATASQNNTSKRGFPHHLPGRPPTVRPSYCEPEQHEQAWLPPPPPRPAAYSASQLLRARTTRASEASPTTSQAGRLQCVPATASQNNTSRRGCPHHLPGRPPTVRPSYCEPEQHEQARLPPPPPRPAAYSASQLLRARTTRASVASPTTSQAGRLQCVPATASQNNTSKRGCPHHLPGRPPTVRPSYCEPEQHEQAWLPPPPLRPAAYSASQLLRARTTRASVASPTTSQAGRLQCVPANASQNNTSKRGFPHHLPGRPPTVRPSYCEPEQHEQARLPPPPPRPAAYSASQLLRARTTRAGVASPTTSQAGRLQCVPATASQNNTSKRGFPHHLPGRPPTVRPSYCEPEQHEQAWLPPPPPRPAAYSASQLLRARTTRASVASPTTSQAGRLQCVPATASQNNTSKRGFPHHLPGRPPTVRPSYCEPEQHEQAWLPPPPPRPAAYTLGFPRACRAERRERAAPFWMFQASGLAQDDATRHSGSRRFEKGA